ncbi:MAG: NAD(P)-dependent oxidoreductase [Pseudooceanicola sp.]|nr:NAD(P)-dependent oxidoreductase [Pseudooceanicola sp.]
MIGMLGLGSMGGAMARRMLAQGLEVVGYDPGAAACARLAEAGGVVAAGAQEVADRADIVLACLPSKAASLDCAEAALQGTALELYVEMSTLGRAPLLALDEMFRAAGKGFVDCPISGGPKAADIGGLTAIVSGRPEEIARLETVFAALMGNRFVVGDTPGMAQVCKLVNNILSVTAMVTTCEAISMGVKAGLDAKTMIDVINVSTGRNSATLDKFPKAILPRTFDYGGPLSVGEKDVELYLELARDTGMPAFIGANVANLFHHLTAQLGETVDYARIITVWEAWGGITVGGEK